LTFQTCVSFNFIPERRKKEEKNPKVCAAAGLGTITFHSCKQLSYGHDQMLQEQETRKEGDTVSSLSQVHIFSCLLFFV
jgi:hypothetical protein